MECRTTALRLNRDEFVVWLEGRNGVQAAAFVQALMEEFSACFPEETFAVRLCAGLALGERTHGTEQLIADPNGKTGAGTCAAECRTAVLLL